MPLRATYEPDDHWKPWFGFNLGWSCKILEELNLRTLGPDYRALLDVFRRDDMLSYFEATPDHMVATVQPDRGFPPLPALSATAQFIEPGCSDLTVHYDGTNRVAAAVVFAHPDCLGTTVARNTFLTKCAKWLQRGTNLVVLNAAAPAELHTNLIDLLGASDELAWRSETGLSAVCYRVGSDRVRERIDVWPFALKVGEPLPTIPLWLEADLAVPLDLEATFERTCSSLRIDSRRRR